jgi:hypothetical protein
MVPGVTAVTWSMDRAAHGSSVCWQRLMEAGSVAKPAIPVAITRYPVCRTGSMPSAS